MREKTIHTLDLQFMDTLGTIASYLVPHPQGAVLIESGPGSTQNALTAELSRLGYNPTDVTDVLLTHIHLDHAGAAGWLARQGARVHVHPIGAPHMAQPEKLLASAQRIYGDKMDSMWGEFLPVPADRLCVVEDGDVIEVEGLRFRALETPGHAYHHHAYIYKDVCFTGDIGGVRMAGYRHLRLPMPPPEFHLDKWRESLHRLQQEYKQGSFTRLAPTHFGIFEDAAWHLQAIDDALDEVESWMKQVMPGDPAAEELDNLFVEWSRQRAIQGGLTDEVITPFEVANPSGMSAYGIQRFWKKYRI